MQTAWKGVATTPARSNADIKCFFDRCASTYAEQHGDPQRLLEYRMGLVRTHARLQPVDVVLDVGCGNGHHLLALAPEIARGLGIDLSVGMIDVARARLRSSPWQSRIVFQEGNAEDLAEVASQSIDLAICIGALEHMLDKACVLDSVYRVLRSGGRLFCLTPNGSYLWYRKIAPAIGLATKHLSSDDFLTRDRLARLLRQAGFGHLELGCWTFSPKGDMSPIFGFVLDLLDVVGRLVRINSLRGGLWACAWKD